MHKSSKLSRAEDPRSDEELVAAALSRMESDEHMDVVWVLAARASRPQLDLALRLVDSPVVAERRLGAAILGRLGYDVPAFLDESVARLIGLLQDPAHEVLVDAIYGLGHRGDERGQDAIQPFHEHPSPDVRCAVAYAYSIGGRAKDVPALLALSRDADAETRDWATFGFRACPELDSPEVRAALFARTEDEVGEIRGEALLGLATREDSRVVPLIRRELARPLAGDWVIEAAGLTGDPSLLSDLRAAWQRLEEEDRARFDGTFREAIQALGGTPP